MLDHLGGVRPSTESKFASSPGPCDEFFFKISSSQGRLGMHRYAVDTFLILCYPNSFQYTAVLQKNAKRRWPTVLR